MKDKRAGPLPRPAKGNMSGKTKQFTIDLQIKARQILDASKPDITNQVPIRPLAKQLVAETGCNIDTAKQHIARAIRRARGEWVETQQGGKREGAGFPAGLKRNGQRGKVIEEI